MALNPGPLDAALWSQVAYKGGSDVGVLNFTAAVRDAEDRLYCLALTVNTTAAIDEAAAIEAYRGLEAMLSAE